MTPVAMVIESGYLEFLLVTNSSGNLLLLKIEGTSTLSIQYTRDVNTPEKLVGDVKIQYEKRAGTRDYYLIYFCGSSLQSSGSYQGHVGIINTDSNLTKAVVSTPSSYNAKCKGISIDKSYSRLVVATEVKANLYEGVTMDTSSDLVSPNPTLDNWNILLESYSENLAKKYWTRLIGEREDDDTLVGMRALDQDLIVVVNTTEETYTTGSGSDSSIYRLDVYSGKLTKTATIFGCDTLHSLKSVHIFYQGILALAEVEGTIYASSAYNYFSVSSRSYALMFFSAEDKLADVHVTAIDSTFDNFSIQILQATENSDQFVDYALLNLQGEIGVFSPSSSVFVSTGVSGCSTNTVNGNLCLACTSNKWNVHVCEGSCPTGTYSTGTYCAKCNRLCSACTSASACSSCSGSDTLVDGICYCSGDEVRSYGFCESSCGFGYKVLHDSTCMKECPSNLMTVGNWVDSSFIANRSITESVTQSGSTLAFLGTDKGLKLSAPTSLNVANFPKSLTMTLWIAPTVWKTSKQQTLIKAFGYLYLWKLYKTISTTEYPYPWIRIGNNYPTSISDSAITSLNLLGIDKWTFIGISKRRVKSTDGNYYAEFYLAGSTIRAGETAPDPYLAGESASDFLLTSVTASSCMSDIDPEELKNYIMFGGEIDDTTEVATSDTSFTGYMREFKIIKSYMGIANLMQQKYHAHSPYYHDLLVYWRFDETASSSTATLKDYTTDGNDQVIISSSSSFPHFINTPSGFELSLTRWDELYSCWNPLTSGSTILPVAVSYEVYNAMASSGSYLLFNVENDANFTTGDELYITNGPCSSLNIVAKKALLCDSSCAWTDPDSSLTFVSLSAGKHYSFCFYSLKYDSLQWLTSIYVPRPPTIIIPYKKLLYTKIETEVTLTTDGGDDGFDNIIYAARSASAISTTVETTQCKITKKLGTSYNPMSFLTPPGIYPGKYFLYWSYSSSDSYPYYTQLNSFIKKIEIAQIYFKNNPTLRYKKGLYSLNATNEDAIEGDQVAFFSSLLSDQCDSATKVGPAYEFRNNRFPQIYFADSDEYVLSYAGTNTYKTLYLCFSSASSGSTAFYPIQSYNIEESTGDNFAGEVNALYPPFLFPLVFPGKRVQFNISSSTNYNYSFHSGGRIQINELFPIYMSPKFVATAADEIVTLADNSFQIPFDEFEYGREYELSIYSETFISGSYYLFGSIGSNLRTFRYNFRIYDFVIDNIGAMNASNTSLYIYGKNFSSFDPEAEIGDYTIRYDTTSLSVSFNLNDSDCSDITPTGELASYNNTMLNITNFNFNGCTKGNLHINLNISRECVCVSPSGCSCYSISISNRVDDQTFFIKTSSLSDHYIGYLGCDKSCLTCSGFTASDCTSCDPNGTLPYLNGSTCLGSCPSSYSLISISTVIADNITYNVSTCGSTCLDGMYFIDDIYGGSCEACDSSCATCNGPLSINCLSCGSSDSFLWEGSCISGCPTGQNDSSNNCLETVGNTNGSVDIDSVGDALGYITGNEDIYLKLVVNNKSEKLTELAWMKIPADNISRDFPMFDSDIGINQTMAIIRKEYIHDILLNGEKLVVGATAKLCNRNVASICGNASDVIIFTKRAGLTAGTLSISPTSGVADNTSFTITLTSWVLFNVTQVQIWAEYSDQRVLAASKNVNESSAIDIGSVTFPSWRVVDSLETQTIQVHVIAKYEGEFVNSSISLDLINNFTSNNCGEKLKEYSELTIDTEEKALLVSTIVGSSRVDSTSVRSYSSTKCLLHSDCSGHGLCVGKKCVCDKGWRGVFCFLNSSSFVYISKISNNIQQYLKSNYNSSISSTLTAENLATYSHFVKNLGQVQELVSQSTLSNMSDYLRAAEQSLNYTSIRTLSARQKKDFIEAILMIMGIESENYESSYFYPTNYLSSVVNKTQLDARVNQAEEITQLKKSIYSFMGKITRGLVVNETFSFSNDQFEVSLGEYTTDLLGSTQDASYTYFNMNTSGAGFTIPSSIFGSSGPEELQPGNVAKVRMMKWTDNPYQFAKTAKKNQIEYCELELP